MRASLPTKKLTVLALFTALSLAIYAAECALPPLLPLPGMKLGLANIVTMAAMLLSAEKRQAWCCFSG